MFHHTESAFDDFVEEEPYAPDERRRTLYEMLFDFLGMSESTDSLIRRLVFQDISRAVDAPETVRTALGRARLHYYSRLNRAGLVELVTENIVEVGTSIEPCDGYLSDDGGNAVVWLYYPHSCSPDLPPGITQRTA